MNESYKEGILGSLADPSCYHDPLNISGCHANQPRHFLYLMQLIRKAEQKLAMGRKEGLIGGPVHLGAGQEAVAVGVSSALLASDRIFGAHRSHSHLLALGSSLHGLFAEILGKKTGLSKGMGGSMHLWDQPRGFYGSVPIVAGTVPLAVGAAMAAKLQETTDVGVAYLGDGAVEEGVVHESLNLARIQNLPVLFVVENNLFASHMHISLRQPKNSTARFAEANSIPWRVVDGNDVAAVSKAANELISDMRAGKGPGFLEAVTFRWYGRVGWREDIDVGVYRSVDELENWRARDPISRLRIAMIASGIWTEKQEKSMHAEIDCQVSSAWAQAVIDPYPDSDALYKSVYEG